MLWHPAFTSADIKFSSYQTKPMCIEVTRWDPLSGGASAVLATAVDMAESITGMVTKPIDEYQHEQRRRDRERKREASRQGKHESASQDGRSSTTSRISGTSSVEDSGKPNSRPGAAVVAGASARSIGMLAPTAAKGMLVDVPLAITEGLKVVPQHFGTKIRQHVPVTDAKSGAVVAGKTFAWGFVDGLSDLVLEPARGASNEGALGAVKGVGKGAVSLVTKSGAGMFGLFAYPSAGLAKSLRTAVHSSTRKLIAKAKHSEGQWLLEPGLPPEITADALVSKFLQLKRRG